MRLVKFFLLLLMWAEPAHANFFSVKPDIGKMMPPQKNREEAYHYGHNGQMKVNEIAGLGNWYTAEHWEYGTREAKRKNKDDWNQNPSVSPYAVFDNSPIWKNDPLGDVPRPPLIIGGPSLTNGAYEFIKGFGKAVIQTIGAATRVFEHGKGNPNAMSLHQMGNAVANGFIQPVNNFIQNPNPENAGSLFGLAFMAKMGGEQMGAKGGDLANGYKGFDASTQMRGASNNLPSRLSRVVPAGVKVETLGRPGDADVFVTDPSAIKGLNSQQISEKLSIPQSESGYKIIEFDAPKEGLAQPYNRSNPGFKNGGKTEGGASEYVVPNAKVSDLKNVTETIVK